MSTQSKEYLESQGKVLVGGRITTITESDDGYPVIFVLCQDRKVRALFVQRDSECNGPGAIEVEDYP